MLISTYNLPHYVLERNWQDNFAALNQLFLDEEVSEIEDLQTSNPRNTLLKYTIGDSSFVFKQPKYLTGNATWYINNEFRFYSLFSGIVVDNYYDAANHVLILPFLHDIDYSEIADSTDNLVKFSVKLATSLAQFHQNLNISYSEVLKFIEDNTLPQSSPYQLLINLLKKAYTRFDILDEVVFPSFSNPSNHLYREILYDLVHDNTFRGALFDFEKSWVEDYLIHGDLKRENIFLKDSLLIFIDFELTTKGDNAWDVACLIDSIIKLPAFKENPKKAYSFFYYFIDSYDKLMNYNESDFINFLGRVLKFWAVKSIDNWRRFNSEGIGDDIFFKSIQRAKLLLLNTDEYMGYIFDDNEKKYEIF